MKCVKCKRGLVITYITKVNDEYLSFCMDCIGARNKNDPRSVSEVRWDLKEEYR